MRTEFLRGTSTNDECKPMFDAYEKCLSVKPSVRQFWTPTDVCHRKHYLNEASTRCWLRFDKITKRTMPSI